MTRFHSTDYFWAENACRNSSVDRLQQVRRARRQVPVTCAARTVDQSRLDAGKGREYLLRVNVDEPVNSATVVTAYRTGTIDTYWSAPRRLGTPRRPAHCMWFSAPRRWTRPSRA